MLNYKHMELNSHVGSTRTKMPRPTIFDVKTFFLSLSVSQRNLPSQVCVIYCYASNECYLREVFQYPLSCQDLLEKHNG